MATTVLPRRAAGVALPISALPSRGPIGDLGPAAYAFVDWLKSAGQRYWQILPLTLTDSHGSPYASPSSMAGNWLYLDPSHLKTDGFLPADWSEHWPTTARVEYRLAAQLKWRMIRDSWRHFQTHVHPVQHRDFLRWRQDQAVWLVDFTLYQAIKDRQGHRPWWRWPKAWRHPATARRLIDRRLRQRMDLHAYAQWLFERQWRAFHAYARKQGIVIIGDMPFYVQDDSAEVWSQPELFSLNRKGRPAVVAGVPPDDFNHAGQRWGNPVYAWPAHRRQKFAWWVRRVERLSQLVDVIRMDHFQGLAETYHIRPSDRTGRQGRWVRTPGHDILQTIRRHLPRVRLIAEDVGHPEPDAEHLRHRYHLPGIRIAIFGWSGLPDNIHHPKFVRTDCLYFTSTHDTNTIVGWWRNNHWYERLHVKEWLGHRPGAMPWPLIEIVWRSRARVAIASLQDLLGLGQPARLNMPGRTRTNWRWRMSRSELSRATARRLKRLTAAARRS